MITQQNLQIQVGSATHIGGRANNEDAILAQKLPATADLPEGGWILAVADGMGGHEHGELASSIAIKTIADTFTTTSAPNAELALKQAFRDANVAIYQAGEATPDKRPGTTLVAAVVRGKYVTIANVGDSRAYLARANRLAQITSDHSEVAEQVRAGTLLPEEARNSGSRNRLTAALGTEPQLGKRLPDIFEIMLLPEDRLLLCSDGFFDVLEQDDYLQALNVDDAQSSALALSELAVQRSTTDNVSAVVLTVGSSLATRQRAEIAKELAEHRAEHGTSILIPVAAMILITLAIVIGVWYWMF